MTMVLDTGMPPFLGLEGGVDSESEKMKGLVSEGNWDSVLKLIEDDLVASNLILTPMKNSGDTLLHVAASEGQNEVVKIVRELLREELQDMPGNAFGNTPLHLAAGNGHAETCRLIIEVAPDLITKTNDDGLTPIFLAALTGYYDAFSALTSMRLDLDDAQIALKRGNGGDTILHCALTLENFDLASEIIKKFSQLIYCRNERGLTPLHILANNPSAFRSGCELGLLDRFFYESISVPTESKLIESSEKKKEDYSHKLAGNYLLCWTFFNLLWSLLWSALSALGFSGLTAKTRKRKSKHVWACKVMHQLLDDLKRDLDFRGMDTGMDPHLQPSERMEEIKTNTTLEVSKTPTPEEEIASESETDSTQESQRTPGQELNHKNAPKEVGLYS
ncbi:hypothetical protein AAC387_Pa01g0559 [Persea americana]